MNMKSQSVSKIDLSFTLLLFAAFSLLFYMFPYSGDDWAWGSQIGVDRLKTWFDNYNGRYLGNLLVMVLTRSKFVNVLLTAISMVCFCLFPKLFASYMMLAAACVALLVYVEERLRIPSAIQKALIAVALVACVVVMCSLVNIYRAVHHYDTLRNEYVQKQLDAGYQTVVMSRLPYGNHVWCSDPVEEWGVRYKLFYGIGQDVEFELLEPWAFDEWMKGFDESHG